MSGPERADQRNQRLSAADPGRSLRFVIERLQLSRSWPSAPSHAAHNRGLFRQRKVDTNVRDFADFSDEELEITELPEREEMLKLLVGSLNLDTGPISILGLITI